MLQNLFIVKFDVYNIFIQLCSSSPEDEIKWKCHSQGLNGEDITGARYWKAPSLGQKIEVNRLSSVVSTQNSSSATRKCT